MKHALLFGILISVYLNALSQNSFPSSGTAIARGGIVDPYGYWDAATTAEVSVSGGNLSGGGPQTKTFQSYWRVTSAGQYITIDLRTSLAVHYITFGTYWSSDGRYIPKDYTIQGSNDNNSYTTVLTVTGNADLSPVNNTGAASYRYWRIVVDDFQPGYTIANITGLQILISGIGGAANGKYWGSTFNSTDISFTGGSVGIGTVSPASKLEVAGTITAGDWIDFKNTDTRLRVVTGPGNIILGDDDKIGVGTTAPVDRLDIAGTTSSSAGRVMIGDNGSWQPHVKMFKWTGSGANYYQTTIASSLTSGGSIDFQTGSGTGGLIGSESQATRLTIQPSGFIGIGTSAPSELLHIAGLNAENPGMRVTSSGVLVARIGETGSTNDGGLELYNSAGGNPTLIRGEGASYLMGGNVGIGTTTPSEKLAVNGNIKARKLIVTTSQWPDYVFKSGYKLRTLDMVEAFIKKNKHLPDVPSEKEISEGGLDVGSMQAILLQKIEELTLYLIEQNKVVEGLKKEISALRARK